MERTRSRRRGHCTLPVLHLDFLLTELTSWCLYLTIWKCLLILFFNCDHGGAKNNKTQVDSLPLLSGQAGGDYVGDILWGGGSCCHRERESSPVRDSQPAEAPSTVPRPCPFPPTSGRRNLVSDKQLHAVSKFPTNLVSTPQGRPHLGLFFSAPKSQIYYFF